MPRDRRNETNETGRKMDAALAVLRKQELGEAAAMVTAGRYADLAYWAIKKDDQHNREPAGRRMNAALHRLRHGS
jgi:hypothetical protein